MSEKKVRQIKVKKKKAKEYRLGFNWFFWICFVLICIPVGYFLYLLYQASQESNVPIVGERIKHSVAAEISESQLQSVSSGVSSMSNIDKASANLTVATLRVTVDAKDGLSKEEYEQLIIEVYGKVDSLLPVSEYFTSSEDYKEYDLEICLYDDLNKEEPFIMNLTKNAPMEEYRISNFTEPLNADLAYQLTHEEDTDE